MLREERHGPREIPPVLLLIEFRRQVQSVLPQCQVSLHRPDTPLQLPRNRVRVQIPLRNQRPNRLQPRHPRPAGPFPHKSCPANGRVLSPLSAAPFATRRTLSPAHLYSFKSLIRLPLAPVRVLETQDFDSDIRGFGLVFGDQNNTVFPRAKRLGEFKLITSRVTASVR